MGFFCFWMLTDNRPQAARDAVVDIRPEVFEACWKIIDSGVVTSYVQHTETDFGLVVSFKCKRHFPVETIPDFVLGFATTLFEQHDV